MALLYNFQKLCIYCFALIITTSSEPCYKKNCSFPNYCNAAYGNAVCYCPRGYYLQKDNRTCLLDPCYDKGCHSPEYCGSVAGNAVCLCPSGYQLLSDNKSCVSDLCYEKNCMHYNNYYYCRVISGVALCSCPYRYYLQSDNRTCLDFYALCNIKNCYSYSYCNIVYGNAICSCPYGYYLQSDKRTCLIDPNKLCELKRCDFNLCQVVSGKAVCFCPSGYYLQQNGLSCRYGHSTKLSGAFIVLIVFGVIFCVFLFTFFCAIYLRGKRKFDPVTVQFYATTQSAVVQGAAQNHLNSVDFQIGVNNTIDSNILYPSNEIEIDNVAHFNMAPPPYELLEQSLSLILSTESPPDYSN